MPFCPWLRFSPLHDGQIRIQVTVTDCLEKFEAALESPFIQVVEKQTADTPRLFSMPQIEVAVTPVLEAGMDSVSKRFTGSVCGLMPADDILFHRVIWRQVVAAAKPPDRGFTFFFRDQKPDIGVAGRYMWTLRVDNQGNAQCFEAPAREFRPGRGGGRWQAGARYVRVIYPGLLKHGPLVQHPGAPAPTQQRALMILFAPTA